MWSRGTNPGVPPDVTDIPNAADLPLVLGSVAKTRGRGYRCGMRKSLWAILQNNFRRRDWTVTKASPDLLSDKYVMGYRDSHSHPKSTDYRLGYWKYGLINFLFSDYKLLDVGCGTGGFYQLLTNVKVIVGIDQSQKMVAVARQMAVGKEYEGKVNFFCGTFEEFRTADSFDVIVLGVYGTYVPLQESVLRKAESLLSPGGFIVVRFHHTNRLIALTMDRHIVLNRARLLKLISVSSNLKIVRHYSESSGLTAFLALKD